MKIWALAAFLFFSATGHGQILNRSILDVDGFTYTQRDLEIYSLAKEALFWRKGVPAKVVNAETWVTQLEAYKNEMLINGLFNREAQRLTSFIPNGEMVNEALKVVWQSLKKSSALKSQFEFLKVTTGELKAQVILVLKVQAYLKSKSSKVGQKDWMYKVDTEAVWFERISRNMSYRLYSESQHYKKLVGFQ